MRDILLSDKKWLQKPKNNTEISSVQTKIEVNTNICLSNKKWTVKPKEDKPRYCYKLKNQSKYIIINENDLPKELEKIPKKISEKNFDENFTDLMNNLNNIFLILKKWVIDIIQEMRRV